MTTASTNTVIAQDTNAHFILWIQEVLTNLITVCGITQATDTGQITSSMGPPVVNAATTIPSANGSAGYVILTFNDTLQSTSAVFIKLEFGCGSSTATPFMWCTIGTGSNGAGTLSGAGTRVAIGGNTTLASTVTNYVSRFCYNATQGVCWMSFKISSTIGGNNIPVTGFVIYRSVDSTGAPTATSVHLLADSSSATGQQTGSGFLQGIDYSLSATFGPTGSGIWSWWAFVPFFVTSTLEGTSAQVFPMFQRANTASVSALGITNVGAIAVNAEMSVGSTITATVLGSLSLTYINAGQVCCTTGMTPQLTGGGTYGMALLWQ